MPVFRFGHSRSILPLYVRLGLFNDSNPLLADNYGIHHNRHWQLAKINAFSSNVAFILYNCGQQYKVRTFINENEIHLPGCNDITCSLQELKTIWSDLIGQCKFDELCDQNEAKDVNIKDLNKSAFHHA